MRSAGRSRAADAAAAAASAESPKVSPGSRPLQPTATIVVTVRNEARHIGDLLDSLVVQEPPFEIVVIDAESTDSTTHIVKRYQDEYPNIRLIVQACRRGGGRNLGVREARGEIVCFIDGDCIANPFWLARLRKALQGGDIAAGRTIQIGYWAFEALGRVELDHRGFDVTYPSCNLAYWREVFEKVGGFDDTFHTAEDIDLNWRAVDVGATIAYDAEAIVYHRARDSITKFLHQAYWNGYGRKQLTLKHGSMWQRYSFRRMLQQQASFWGLLRLASASLGYLAAKIKEKRPA